MYSAIEHSVNMALYKCCILLLLLLFIVEASASGLTYALFGLVVPRSVIVPLLWLLQDKSSFSANICNTVYRYICCFITFTNSKVFLTSYMSTQREVFEGQKAARRAKRGRLWKGVRGSSPGIFQKPVLQMVQSELFLS